MTDSQKSSDTTESQETAPKERISFRTEEPPWYVRAIEFVGDVVLLLVLVPTFSAVVFWEFARNQYRSMKSKAAVMQERIAAWWNPPNPQDDDDDEVESLQVQHWTRYDDAIAKDIGPPRWLAEERKREAWVKNVLDTSNPGTLISCHNCPFRVLESERNFTRTAGGWGDSIGEREAFHNALARFDEQHTIPVCGHPANGVWGPTRHGAHFPDEHTCPRAILAKMNPARRVWCQWKMKRHLQRHANVPHTLK